MTSASRPMTEPAPPVIGLGGRLRSGKDTVADYLATGYGFAVVGMSDALLTHCRILNPWIKVRLLEAFRLRLRPGFHRLDALVRKLGYVDAKTIRDFREFMQRDGTEGGRKFFGEHVWTDLMAASVRRHQAAGSPVAVTGLRYLNEIDALEDLGATTYWVQRPTAAPSAASATHSSETSVDSADFGHVIDNSGSLADLYRVVDGLADDLHLTPIITKDPTTA